MYDDPRHAITREKELKKWRRAWKLDLIEKMNPEWIDLYDAFAGSPRWISGSRYARPGMTEMGETSFTVTRHSGAVRSAEPGIQAKSTCQRRSRGGLRSVTEMRLRRAGFRVRAARAPE